LAGGLSGKCAWRHEDLHAQTYQLSGLFGEKLRAALGEAPLDAQVLAFDPAELARLINEGIGP
jgi:hypothetical protein